MIMGLAYMTSPPTFVTWYCLNCVSIVCIGFMQCWQLDHSFPAVLDILRKGLNLQAPLDIQWPKCFQLQGGFAPQTPVIDSCSALAMVPPNSFCRLWSSCLEPSPLILTSLRLWRRGVVVSGVRRMNEVNARRARLVPGWVTVFGQVCYLDM